MDKLREIAAVNWRPLPRDHGRLAALRPPIPYLRQFTPHVLSAIDFQGGPGMADLMDAVEILKDLNRAGGRKVPAGAPACRARPVRRLPGQGPQGRGRHRVPALLGDVHRAGPAGRAAVR